MYTVTTAAMEELDRNVGIVVSNPPNIQIKSEFLDSFSADSLTSSSVTCVPTLSSSVGADSQNLYTSSACDAKYVDARTISSPGVSSSGLVASDRKATSHSISIPQSIHGDKLLHEGR